MLLFSVTWFPTLNCILLTFIKLHILPKSPATELVSQVTCQPADWLSLGQVLTGWMEVFTAEGVRKCLQGGFFPNFLLPRDLDTSVRICNSVERDITAS